MITLDVKDRRCERLFTYDAKTIPRQGEIIIHPKIGEFVVVMVRHPIHLGVVEMLVERTSEAASRRGAGLAFSFTRRLHDSATRRC